MSMQQKDIHKKVKKLEKKKIRVQDELDELQDEIDELREICQHGAYKQAQPNICQVCFKYVARDPSTTLTTKETR